MTAPRASAKHRHPDRNDIQPWLMAGIVAAAGVCVGVAAMATVEQRGGSPLLGFLAGTGAAALATVGLPSLSVRVVARAMLVASGGVLVRFGSLDGSLTSGSQEILAWLVAAVAVFVLTDRVGTDAQRPLGPTTEAGTDTARQGRASGGRTARTWLLAVLGVLVVATVLTPFVLPRMSQAASVGEGPRIPEDGSGSSVLRSTESLDMTTRPDLTDEVVFRVTTDRPTFWRGEIFDQWDGRRWTRSDEQRFFVADGRVETGPNDLGAQGPDRFTQRIRMESSYADVIYGAPSMVSVEASRPLAQRLDGTVVTAQDALGRGATYEVTSRRPALTEERLRAAGGAVPEQVEARYAQPPVISDRVRQAAVEVAGSKGTTYDKIRALETWMGDRTEYSLDAPLSPTGVDVVDHFLFDSRLGWCEQVASSLVVMARANAIPARLATGFVPDERDRVTGSYVVRARDAHSWTEVWFPEVGWVAFDPTANVPLAASARAEGSWGKWLLDHALVILIGAGLLVAVGWPLLTVLRRRRTRMRVARTRSTTWAGIADRRLVALGDQAARARSPGESATAYADAIALLYGDEGLALVGRAIDDGLFARTEPDAAHRDQADAALTRCEAMPPPEPGATGSPADAERPTPVD